jgi:hypothetical protein
MADAGMTESGPHLLGGEAGRPIEADSPALEAHSDRLASERIRVTKLGQPPVAVLEQLQGSSLKEDVIDSLDQLPHPDGLHLGRQVRGERLESVQPAQMEAHEQRLEVGHRQRAGTIPAQVPPLCAKMSETVPTPDITDEGEMG